VANIREIDHADWVAEATAKFGADPMGWTFVCPVCNHPQSTKDYKDAGAPQECVGFSCIGRWLENANKAFEEGGEGPCNYAGGGLFRLNPVRVRMPDGAVVEAFEWATTTETT
jgi:hypothetical protein